jgi:hypothetical protein
MALGCKYTLSPAPNYPYCTDPEDNIQLTDGKTTNLYFWTQKGTVGWSGAQYVTVTVDLGRVEPISGVSFDTAAGVAGVIWPAAIRILVSDDGRAFRDVGDLVALDRKAHGPLPEKYAIRRLATGELRTKGRYVCFLVVPLSGGQFVFVDEVEVFRGPGGLLAADPGGRPVGDAEQVFREGRIRRAVSNRLQKDIESLSSAARRMPPVPERKALLEQLDQIRAAAEAEKAPTDGSFKAVLPMTPVHARLFQLQAALWKAWSFPDFWASGADAWEPLDAIDPGIHLPTPEIAVELMRGEYRAAAATLWNATPRPIDVRLSFEGLPGGAMPDYVTVHEVQWTDTSHGIPVASALPEAKGGSGRWTVTVLPGLIRQVWFTLHPVDVTPGEYCGSLRLEPVVGDGAALTPLVGARKSKTVGGLWANLRGMTIPCIGDWKGEIGRLPFLVHVWPMEFPKKTTLLLGGWSYTDGGGSYGVTPENRRAFLDHLQSHFVNAPWASAAVMFDCRVEANPPRVELNTQRMDDWLAQWPHARQYMVFLSVGSGFGGAPAGSATFDRVVGLWISAWVRHLAAKGIAPDRLCLLLVDEPNEGTPAGDVSALVAWARAIRAAEPKVTIWEDPTYSAPWKSPAELFAVSNVLCPNRPMWLEGGKPFEEFYLKQRAAGKTLNFYSCSGPAKLLDPYSYYRLQAWHCWQVGGTGSFFWAFGDNSGSSSWNEYLSAAGPYTPLFLDQCTVVAGKQMEAIRESVEDYEYLVMLRVAVRRAEAGGRTGPAVAKGQSLLAGAARKVLAAPGAEKLSWRDPKDRRLADAVRVEILEALAELAK